MTCNYCRAQNASDDHRCGRCGRRLADVPLRPESFPVQFSAAAPALDIPSAASEAPRLARPQLVTELPKQDSPREPAFQASLFGPQEVTSPLQTPAPQRRSVAGGGRVKRDLSAQAALNFENPEQTAVYGNAPVAIAAHRTIAAAVDLSLSMIGVACFAAVFYLKGYPLTPETTSGKVCFALAAVLISVFYRLLFCIGNCDTLGSQVSGLRLLNFDGRRPSRRQRFARLIGGFISMIAAGIGLAWALVDEDKLTWHDYISKTFPTPRISQ